MKTLKSYLEEGKAADIMGLLKTFGAGDLDIGDDYISTMLRKKQQVWDIVDRLPPDTDYEVYVYEINNGTAARELENPQGLDKTGLGDPDEDEYTIDEIGAEDLTDQFHEYNLIVYLFNTVDEYMPEDSEASEPEDSDEYDQENEDAAQIAMEELSEEELAKLSPEELEERKRIIKVNAKGQRRIKIKCKKGFKYADGKCMKITGSELTTKRKAIRRSVRTKKQKGSGYQRKIQRLRGRAVRKRRSMGLKTSFEHETNNDVMTEARRPSKKENKVMWMKSYEQNLTNRKDYKAGKIDWDTALHMFFTGADAKTAAETVKSPYK
jgi:hypothetical protein